MSTTEPPATATRERIIAAAQALFLRDGYAAVGINAICAAAQVVKGSFYHYFPAKSDLLVAVIARNRAERMAALQASASAAADGRSQVSTQFELILETLRRQRDEGGRILGCPIGTLASSLPAEQAEASRAAGEALEAWREALAAQVLRGVKDGSIARSVDPESAASSLLAMLQGMATLGRCGADESRLRDMGVNALKRLLPVGPVSKPELDQVGRSKLSPAPFSPKLKD